MSKENRVSRPATTPYKNPRKPLMSKGESKRQKNSYKSYNINGGGNDAS